MYQPISINEIDEARYAIRKGIEGLLRAQSGGADLRYTQKQTRTLTYKLMCQAARRQAEQVLASLPSDARLEALTK